MKAALKEHAAAPNYAASAGTRDSFGQIQLPASRQERSAIGHHWNHAAAEPLIILESTHLPAARTNFWGQVRLAAAIVAVLRCSLAFFKFRFKFTARTRSIARCDTLHLYDPAIYVLHRSEQMSNDSRFRSVPINLICGFNFCLGGRDPLLSIIIIILLLRGGQIHFWLHYSPFNSLSLMLYPF